MFKAWESGNAVSIFMAEITKNKPISIGLAVYTDDDFSIRQTQACARKQSALSSGSFRAF
jgi:hypothetical protein